MSESTMASEDVSPPPAGTGPQPGERRPGLLTRLAGTPRPAGVGRGSTLLRHLTVAIIVIAVVFLATYRLQTFYDYQLATVAAYLCAVAGLTVLTGLNGQVSLGHSALMATGAYTVALMQGGFANHHVTAQWTLAVSLLGALVVTAVAGAIIGLAAARLRGPYLAGVTLAVAVTVPAIATTYRGLLGGDQGLSVPVDPPPASLGAAFPAEQWQAWIGTLAAAVVMLLLANLVRSRFGRTLRAVRDDEIAARLVGIPVARTQVIAFVVSAACAGVGGGVIAAINQAVSPDSYSLTLSLYLLLAIVLGGLGSLIGAVWGAVAIVALPYVTSQIMGSFTMSAVETSKLKDNVPLAIFGLSLVVIAIAAPGGLQGLLRRAGRWARTRISRAPDRGSATQPPASTPEVTT